MKKTYIQPATKVTLLAVQQMICVSGPNASINTSDSVDAANVESRRGSDFWDDEEE